MRGVVKYLVWWKRFTVEHNSWEKKKDLENTKEVAEFEGKMNAEIRQQEKVNMAGERNSRRRELLEKYIAKILYKWNDGKFKEEYLRKFKRN